MLGRVAINWGIVAVNTVVGPGSTVSKTPAWPSSRPVGAHAEKDIYNYCLLQRGYFCVSQEHPRKQTHVCLSESKRNNNN